jgi:hypothetical protein
VGVPADATGVVGGECTGAGALTSVAGLARPARGLELYISIIACMALWMIGATHPYSGAQPSARVWTLDTGATRTQVLVCNPQHGVLICCRSGWASATSRKGRTSRTATCQRAGCGQLCGRRDSEEEAEVRAAIADLADSLKPPAPDSYVSYAVANW